MAAQIQLEAIGTLATGVLGESAAEMTAYDSISQRLFVVNANSSTLDVLNLSAPTNPNLLFSISPTEEGVTLEEPGVIGGINSVAVSNGIVAAAVEVVDSDNDDIQLPGQVFFYNTEGNFLNFVTVGALPDLLTFTPDGTKIIVANEGEPGGDIDSEGSISIIDISGGVENLTDDNVSTADFTAFNGREEELRAQGVRIFPNKTVAPDLEPEYIAVSPDGSTAFVTLQENNAFAVVDIGTRTVTDVIPLGVKDHDLADNGLDGSDRDNAINIQNYPIFGLYQPDGITSFEANGNTYYITANEGDSRDEDERIGNFTLDLDAFPNAEELQSEEQLGRLEASTIDGDLDGDGDYDQLFVYGARSFSIWDGSGNLVFDSGDDFEQIIAAQAPLIFNSNGSPDSFDSRSDNKGPEPESVVTGVIGDRTYAFIGLERVGGIMVYDVTNPANASFVQYVRSPAGDIGPEGLAFIASEDSPNNKPLLVVANEVSGTTTIFAINFGVDTSPEQTFTITSTRPEEPVEIEFEADSAGYITNTLALNMTPAGDGTQVTTQLTNDVLELGTDAAFDNLVGLYEVVNANGGILLEDGTVLLPSDDPSRYAELALTNRVDSFQLRAGSSGDPNLNTTVAQFGDVLLEGGRLYAPFVIANGGTVGDGFINAVLLVTITFVLRFVMTPESLFYLWKKLPPNS